MHKIIYKKITSKFYFRDIIIILSLFLSLARSRDCRCFCIPLSLFLLLSLVHAIKISIRSETLYLFRISILSDSASRVWFSCGVIGSFSLVLFWRLANRRLGFRGSQIWIRWRFRCWFAKMFWRMAGLSTASPVSFFFCCFTFWILICIGIWFCLCIYGRTSFAYWISLF